MIGSQGALFRTGMSSPEENPSRDVIWLIFDGRDGPLLAVRVSLAPS